jgi:hypothetical protein
VPDYSAAAMAAQHRALPSWRLRLAAMNPEGGPIAEQVDRQIVRAEMNGLDFDHRVLRPWANNPAFYVTVFTSESDQPGARGRTPTRRSRSGPTRSRSPRRTLAACRPAFG